MVPAAAPTPAPMRAPLPGLWPVPALIAAPEPAPIAAPARVPQPDDTSASIANPAIPARIRDLMLVIAKLMARSSPLPSIAVEQLDEEVLHAMAEVDRAVAELFPRVPGLRLGRLAGIVELLSRRPGALDHGVPDALGGFLDSLADG